MSEDHARHLPRRDVLVAGVLGAAAAAFDVGLGRPREAAAASGPARVTEPPAAYVESPHMPTTLEKRAVPGHLLQFRTLAAERNADGRILVLGIDQHGRVYQRWQNTPMGGWTEWTALPAHLRSIAVVRNVTGPHDGRLQLFGSDHLGSVWTAIQTTPGSSAWTPLSQIPRTSTGLPGGVVSVTAEANHDGRIDLFAMTSSHQVFLNWQTTAAGEWAGWQNQPGMTPTSVAVPDMEKARGSARS